MASRWPPKIGGPTGGGSPPPPPGGDHFAPRYLIGNVPAGDPAAATLGPFRYLGDPGDGSAIDQAIAESIAAPGDIWIRPGTYTRGALASFSVPANRHIVGAGQGLTNIVGPTNNNIAFTLADGASLKRMTVTHPGGTPGGGPALVVTTGPGVEIDDVILNLAAATADGVLIAAISAGLLAANTVRNPVVLRKMLITLPAGAGGVSVPAWIVGVNGEALGGSNLLVVTMSDVVVNGGDVGVLTTGAEMELDAFFCSGQYRMGLYSNGGRISVTGRRSVIALPAVAGPINPLAGCQLINSTFELAKAMFTTGSAHAIPAVYVSGGAGVASALIEGCEIGSGFSPVMQIGNLAEVVRDARIVNNKITSAAAVVPVAIGAGADNTSVQGNVSRGSGGTLPTDLGTGSNIANNIWGA